MSVEETKSPSQKPLERSWHDRLIIPMLVTGGLLTLTWILALAGVAWRIVSAVAGTPG